MFLHQLRVRNLRSVKDLTLSFATPADATRKWTLLLGENGCGKSTVLRAAALVLAGSDALPHLLGGEVDSWVRHGSDAATIEADLRTADGQARGVKLKLSRGTTIGAIFAENRDSLGELDKALAHADRSYLTVAYGASRRLNTDPESAFRSRARVPDRARNVATLFSSDAVLDPLESWVIDMDYRGKSTVGRDTIRRIATDLMPNVTFHDIDKDKKQLLFKTPDGITPLTGLSDGYQNVAAWCGDLLRSISTTFKDYRDPTAARGLLLIDEIDLHLHPVWQRRLRGFFDRTFPNFQILTTTHSPLTVQQAGEGELYVMRRKAARSAPTIEAFEGTPNTMMIHQLLLSPVFNLDSMDSVKVQKRRERYRKLKRKPNKTAVDEQQLKQLKQSIEELPDLAGGLTKYKKQQTKVLTEIRKALKK